MRAITDSNVAELKRLERIIDKGMETFVDVGNALKAIRDEKLYVASHKTFEAYCKDRWKISRPRAYELIDAAEVNQSLSGIPDKKPNASQSTELAKAPPEERAEVWQEVVESTDKPTAKDVRAAVEKRREPVKVEIVDEVWEDVPDDGDELPAFDPERFATPAPQKSGNTAVEKIRNLLPQAEDKLVVAYDLFKSMDEWQREKVSMLWNEWQSTSNATARGE